MKRSEIYLKVFIKLFDQEHSENRDQDFFTCNEISVLSDSYAVKDEYVELFGLYADKNESELWYNCGDIRSQNSIRMNMLLFAHEIAKSNGN